MWTYFDCEPTLTDGQVLKFVKDGYLALDSVVPDTVNRKTLAFLKNNMSGEPSEILAEDWFVEGVIRNPEAAGAIRSLLGANFGLPVLMSNHRVEYPTQRGHWHRDGNSQFSHEFWNLQVFYIPQACTIEMGPTELLPGTHLLYTNSDHISHLDRVKDTHYMAGDAGSIFITIYSIWHRRASSAWSKTAGVRHNLKYNYHRTEPPTRDWLIDPNFNFTTAEYRPRTDYGYFRDRFAAASQIAEMFLWLCGKHAQFINKGGQSWPIGQGEDENLPRTPYGAPEGL